MILCGRSDSPPGQDIPEDGIILVNFGQVKPVPPQSMVVMLKLPSLIIFSQSQPSGEGFQGAVMHKLVMVTCSQEASYFQRRQCDSPIQRNLIKLKEKIGNLLQCSSACICSNNLFYFIAPIRLITLMVVTESSFFTRNTFLVAYNMASSRRSSNGYSPCFFSNLGHFSPNILVHTSDTI